MLSFQCAVASPSESSDSFSVSICVSFLHLLIGFQGSQNQAVHGCGTYWFISQTDDSWDVNIPPHINMWMAIRVFKRVLKNLRRSKKVSSQKSGSNYLQYFGGMYKEPSRGRLNVLIVQICLTAENLSAESSLGNATCLL